MGAESTKMQFGHFANASNIILRYLILIFYVGIRDFLGSSLFYFFCLYVFDIKSYLTMKQSQIDSQSQQKINKIMKLV